jgi:hypothetical protein
VSDVEFAAAELREARDRQGPADRQDRDDGSDDEALEEQRGIAVAERGSATVPEPRDRGQRRDWIRSGSIRRADG